MQKKYSKKCVEKAKAKEICMELDECSRWSRTFCLRQSKYFIARFMKVS